MNYVVFYNDKLKQYYALEKEELSWEKGRMTIVRRNIFPCAFHAEFFDDANTDVKAAFERFIKRIEAAGYTKSERILADFEPLYQKAIQQSN